MTAPPTATAELARRFFAKVDVHPGGCWLWTGARQSRGYGCLGIDGRRFLAHRVSHEWAIGPIPAGYPVDHLCNVPLCVSPMHLEAVPRWLNDHRSSILGFAAARVRGPRRVDLARRTRRSYGLGPFPLTPVDPDRVGRLLALAGVPKARVDTLGAGQLAEDVA